MVLSNPNELVVESESKGESLEAYNTLRPELEARARAHEDPTPNTDVLAVARVILTIYGNLGPIMDEIASLGALVDQKKIRALKQLALALLGAQAKLASAQTPGTSVDGLVAIVQGHKRGLQLEVDLCIHRGVLPPDSVKLVGGNSYNAWAQDVRALAMLLLEKKAIVSGTISVDEKRLHAAIVAADELISALAQNAVNKDRELDAAQLRNAAFALLVEAYRETQRAVEFVRFHQTDSDTICPNIFNYGNRRRQEIKDATPTSVDPGAGVAVDLASLPAASPTAASNPNVPSRPIAPSRSADK